MAKILVTMFWSLSDQKRLFFNGMVVLRKWKGSIFRENMESTGRHKAKGDK